MKTKTINACKSVKVTDVIEVIATVSEDETHLYVSQNSECHIKLCSLSPKLVPPPCGAAVQRRP
jgi:hypothetical protein